MKTLQNCLKCGTCCLETEMLLSNGDIELINQKVKPHFKFYREKDGYVYLKNISGHCIFFEISNIKCKIYEFRPQGCRFYPFIYDNGRLAIDEDCKNRANIKIVNKDILKKIESFINLIENERNERLNNKRNGS